MGESLETSEGDASSGEIHFIAVWARPEEGFGVVVALVVVVSRETWVSRHGPPSAISNKLQLCVDSSLSFLNRRPDLFGCLIYPRLGTILLSLPSGACFCYPAGWW